MKLPPCLLISRAPQTFHIALARPDEIRQWLNDGSRWQQFAVAEPVPPKQGGQRERQIFARALAFAAKYDALMFQLSPSDNPAEIKAQLDFVCRIYQLFLNRKIPNPSALRQWRAEIYETGVLPFGKPHQPHSSYRALACALMPMLKTAYPKAH